MSCDLLPSPFRKNRDVPRSQVLDKGTPLGKVNGDDQLEIAFLFLPDAGASIGGYRVDRLSGPPGENVSPDPLLPPNENLYASGARDVGVVALIREDSKPLSPGTKGLESVLLFGVQAAGRLTTFVAFGN